ncbi:MAG: single-stranded DNA-binding protein [Bacteroidales bacterium]|nr:single-stranded DNA-binding protein [Bacteroidales bacterium]
MASLNKVILIGRLGKDPEIVSFDNGSKKMSVTLATSERYRDRNGEWVEQTDWHNLVSWGNIALDLAEKRRNYIKGDLMYVEGRIKTRQYVDNQNITRSITEIVVDKMMNMGNTRSAVSNQNAAPGYQQPEQSYQQPSYQQPAQSYQQPSYQQPAPSYQQPVQTYQPLPEMPNPDYDGDDLPF